MTNDINSQAIARIYLNSEGIQSAVGMGVLIADRYVLTCAHVINAALDQDKKCVDKPETSVQLDFPFIESGLKHSGTVVYWKPIDTSKREADIAVLKLDQSLPSSICPLMLRSLTLSSVSRWQAFGCPTDEGYWSEGTFRPPNTLGWRQLNPSFEDSPIKSGFSGSPVFHRENKEALGIVVAIVQNNWNKTAFMLPAELLQSAVGYVDAATILDSLNETSHELSTVMKNLYRECLPDVWEQPEPQNLQEMLDSLSKDVPHANGKDGQSYSGLTQFVAGLLEDNQLSPSVELRLRNWINLKVDDLQALLDFRKQRNAEKVTLTELSTKPSLIIRLSPSQNEDLQKYRIEAWLIFNPKKYNYERVQGVEQLTISEDADQTYTWTEVPGLIQNCVNQAAASPHYVNDPTLEIFLPLKHLNEAVEAWELPVNLESDPFADIDLPPPPDLLGWRYRIVLRSQDRASRRYQDNQNNAQKISDWREKWSRAESAIQKGCLACDVMIDGNDAADPRPLNQRLAPLDAFGVGFVQVKENTEIATVLRAAVPIALWIREPISDAQRLLNDFLKCPLSDVVHKVQVLRLEACNPDTDLGCHLALLWDNPNLLPPREEAS